MTTAGPKIPISFYYFGSAALGIIVKFVPYLLLLLVGLLYHRLLGRPVGSVLAGFEAQSPPFFLYLLVSGIIAPLVENLIIPLFAWVSGSSKTLRRGLVIIVFVLAYFTHGSGLAGVLVGFGFAAFYVLYLFAIPRIGALQGYLCTVIAHSSANLGLYAFKLLL